MPRLIDAHGSYTVNASDNTGYSLAFGGGIISVADEFGHIVAEFDADDAPTIEAEPAPRWIPVTERLPEESDADKDGRVFAVLRREVPKVWHWSIVRDYPTSFTHWMPMPEPPENGGDE